MLCFLQQRGEKVFDSVQALDWRFLQGTLAVLSPSSASHQQRGRRNKGGLLMCLS